MKTDEDLIVYLLQMIKGYSTDHPSIRHLLERLTEYGKHHVAKNPRFYETLQDVLTQTQYFASSDCPEVRFLRCLLVQYVCSSQGMLFL